MDHALPLPITTSAAAPTTLASSVYERLRQDISRGALLPGAKLRIESLRARYRVGASPLREALNRLAAEGLVVLRDQRGFQVAPISLDELLELVRTRCWINEIAVREAMAHGDAAWEEAIVLAFHRLSRTPFDMGSPSDEWQHRHRMFHAALLAACPSQALLEFERTLFDRAERYRNLAGLLRSDPPRDIEGEHREIKDAFIERDGARVIRLLNEHLTQTAEDIRRSPALAPSQRQAT